MSLRSKLLWAQVPLALALMALGVVAVRSIGALGEQSQQILSLNYRSVLAAQEMKEAAERIDSATLFAAAGRQDRAATQIAVHCRQFEQELHVAENNLTEPEEPAVVRDLRQSWTAYQGLLDRYLSLADEESLRTTYFRDVEPAFLHVKQAADRLLQINQDAMVRRSEEAQRLAKRTNAALIATALGALALGLLVSTSLTNRLLRPLSVLTQAVGRLGEGDFRARAQTGGQDEIGGLAGRFNQMADRLAEYRDSSLGELLLAQQASKATINSLDDPVILFDRDGQVLEMNQPAADLLPSAAGSEGGPAETAPPELREPLRTALQHVLHGQGAVRPSGFEDAIAVELPAGRRYYLLRASPVYEQATGVAGATLILQDVTRLHHLDELKNDLVATVAHEFRTPLTSLRMAIHLCLEGTAGPINDKQADLLQAGREDCQRLQATVDELLDLARLQAGRAELQPAAVPAEELFEAVRAAYRAAAAEKQIELVQPLGSAHAVLADSERIAVVLSNLVANAIRHTPEGGSITLTAVNQDQTVRLEVTDTGEGIAPEQQRAVFDKFYRVPGARSGASGLGLSVVREIVAAHGGEVGVDSTPGQGSRFWFTLPKAPA